MKKALLGIGIMMIASCSIWGQEVSGTSGVSIPNRDVNSDSTPGASVSAGVSAVAWDFSRDAISLVKTATDATAAEANGTAGEPPRVPAPAPTPKYIFGDRDDYRWQLEMGVSFVRFQSNIYDASMTGTNTTITYYTNSWLGVEGNLVTGFAPEIYSREHVKYFGGGGGVRIGTRRARFEPWGHVLVGGSHILPQTAVNNSKSSFSVQAGIGLDYRLYARLSLRGETDYLYTRFFKDSQNNFQAALGLVFHF